MFLSSLPVLPDLITFISPIIVAALSGWIGQAHFPAWANALIALGVIVAVTFLCIFVAGARFTGNVATDTVLVLTYATALMYGPFRVIQKFLILGPDSQLPSVRHSPASVAISLKRIGGTSPPIPLQEEQKEIPPSA